MPRPTRPPTSQFPRHHRVVSDATYVNQVIEGKRRSDHADLAVAAIAARQHGVVTRTQLARLGMGRGAADHRIACGRVHPVYRGVYAVGHSLLSVNGSRLAGVLAAGPDAALSHRSAAALWGIWRGRALLYGDDGPSLAASTSRSDSPRRDDSRRRSDHQPRHPCDLGAPHPSRPRGDPAPLGHRAGVRTCEALRLTDALSLADLVARYPRRPGVATSRAIYPREGSARPSPAANLKTASWLCWPITGCLAPRSTRWSSFLQAVGSRWTACGPTPDS